MDNKDEIVKMLLQQEQSTISLGKMVESIGDILQMSQATLSHVDKIRSKLLEDGILSLLSSLNIAVEKQTSAIKSLENAVNSTFIKLTLGFLGMSVTVIAAALAIFKLFLER